MLSVLRVPDFREETVKNKPVLAGMRKSLAVWGLFLFFRPPPVGLSLAWSSFQFLIIAAWTAAVLSPLYAYNKKEKQVSDRKRPKSRILTSRQLYATTSDLKARERGRGAGVSANTANCTCINGCLAGRLAVYFKFYWFNHEYPYPRRPSEGEK